MKESGEARNEKIADLAEERRKRNLPEAKAVPLNVREGQEQACVELVQTLADLQKEDPSSLDFLNIGINKAALTTNLWGLIDEVAATNAAVWRADPARFHAVAQTIFEEIERMRSAGAYQEIPPHIETARVLYRKAFPFEEPRIPPFGED